MSPNRGPLISVVVPTYRRQERVAALLEQLVHQTLAAADFEVVVVDNFSDDDTSDVVRRLAPSLPFTVTWPAPARITDRRRRATWAGAAPGRR